MCVCVSFPREEAVSTNLKHVTPKMLQQTVNRARSKEKRLSYFAAEKVPRGGAREGVRSTTVWLWVVGRGGWSAMSTVRGRE